MTGNERPKLELDKRRLFTRKQRAEIFARAGGHCDLCLAKVTGPWTAGHITAHALGGPTTVENGQCECEGCSPGTHREDTSRVAKAKRQAGETGQQARRARKGPQLKSRGFDKTRTKKMNGDVVSRKQKKEHDYEFRK